MSVATTPIIISAPPGGLGRHLAALIDYAVNPGAEVPSFYKKIEADLPVTQFVAPTTQALSPLQFWHWDFDLSNRIPVFYTTQSPADIAKDYPDGRIIQITTTNDDALQLGYNYTVVEQWRSIGTLLDTFYTDIVEQILNEDTNWKQVFSDTQFMDNSAVQLLIGSVASAHITDASGEDTRSDLAVEFNTICCPANTAGNADITPILNFLGEIPQDATEVSKVWYTFIRSLHHAKRNILNTANWS